MYLIVEFVLLIELIACDSSDASSSFCDVSSNGMIDTSMTTVRLPKVIEHFIFRDKYKWKLNIKCSESDDCEKGLNDNEILVSNDINGEVFSKGVLSESGESLTIPANLSFAASGFESGADLHGKETEIESYEIYKRGNVCVIVRKEESTDSSPPNIHADTAHAFCNINVSASINPLEKGFFVTLNQNRNNQPEYSRKLSIQKSHEHTFDMKLLSNVVEKSIDQQLYINGFFTIALSNDAVKLIVFVTHNGIGKHCYVSDTKNCSLNELIENYKVFRCTKIRETTPESTDNSETIIVIMALLIAIVVSIIISLIFAIVLYKMKKSRLYGYGAQ